jgi:hypothetical protein
LIEVTQRLSPEERLNVFLEHCRLVTQLYEAAETMRASGYNTQQSTPLVALTT